MPFFLKSEGGSTVSDMLDERLKWLQKQLDESQKSCDRLRGEVLAFTTAAREMCRCAGSAAQAFSAALDASQVLPNDRKDEATVSISRDSMASWAPPSTRGRRASFSVSPRDTRSRLGRRSFGEYSRGTASRVGKIGLSATEPIRSELLSFQLKECAAEMEADLKTQVLQKLEELSAGRDEIQAALKERSRAADNLAAGHRDYARAVARCQASGVGSGRGDAIAGPPADIVHLGDRVIRASDAFAEAHGEAEEALTRLLMRREEILEGAMLSLKALQAVFFVRVGHCVSSSTVPTPPHTPTRSPSTSPPPTGTPVFSHKQVPAVDRAERRVPQGASGHALHRPSALPKIFSLSEAAADSRKDLLHDEPPESPGTTQKGQPKPEGTSVSESIADVSNLVQHGTCAQGNLESGRDDATLPDEDERAAPVGLLACAADAMEDDDADDDDALAPGGRVAQVGSSVRHSKEHVPLKGIDIEHARTDTSHASDDARNDGRGRGPAKADVVVPEGRNDEDGGEVGLQEKETKTRRSSWFGRFTTAWGLGPAVPSDVTNGEQEWHRSCPTPVREDDDNEVMSDSSLTSGVRDSRSDEAENHDLSFGSLHPPEQTKPPAGASDGENSADAGRTQEVISESGAGHVPVVGLGHSHVPVVGLGHSPGENMPQTAISSSLVKDPGAQEIRDEARTPIFSGGNRRSVGSGGGGRGSHGRGRDHRHLTEDSDSEETGSNTTEGFGSDDAAELWGEGILRDGPSIEDSLSQAFLPQGLDTTRGNIGEVDTKGGDDVHGNGEIEARAEEEEATGNACGPREQMPSEKASVDPSETSREAPDADEPAQAAAESGETSPGCRGTPASETLEDMSGKEGAAGIECRESDQPLLMEGETLESSSCKSDSLPRKKSFWPKSPTSLPSRPPLPEPPLMIVPPVETATSLEGVSSLNDSSPGMSDAGNSPMPSWRLSWWARASDRHPPPPPVGSSADDNEVISGSALANTLLTAGAGGEAASAMSAGGGTASALPGMGGDGPAAVDGVRGLRNMDNTAIRSGKAGDAGNAPAVAAITQAARIEAATEQAREEAAAAAERRAWNRGRRRRSRLRLVVERLVDDVARPLEAACDFLDVVGLSRGTGVCRAWSFRLRAEGATEWNRCVKLANGIPSEWRGRFYMHVLYDQPAWLSKAHERKPLRPPSSEVYRDCLQEAGAQDAARKVVTPRSHHAAFSDSRGAGEGVEEGAERDARQDDSSTAAQVTRSSRMSLSPPQYWNWLDEIDTDVLRTCPDDSSPVSVETSPQSSTDRSSDSSSGELRDIGGIILPANWSGAAWSGDGSSAVGGDDQVPYASSSISGEHGDRAELGKRESVDAREGEGVSSGIFAKEEAAPPGKLALNGAEVLAERDEVAPGVPSIGSGGGRDTGTGSGIGVAQDAATATATATATPSVGWGGTREKLRRMLRAFAVYNPRVSYCQGMNFLALALLEGCAGDDEMAFWVLVGMCARLDLEALWCQGLERLDFCFFALDRLLRLHCPSLHQHLADEGVQLNMFTSRWFVTLFACNDVFGRSTSRKILDMFLLEKWPLMFKISLGVLLEMRPLLEPTDMEGILEVTKFPRAQLFGLRRDSTGRRVAGATFEEATQGSLCEAIRAGTIVEHALLLPITEETLQERLLEHHHQRLQRELEPGSD